MIRIDGGTGIRSSSMNALKKNIVLTRKKEQRGEE
jgi:hypothetical protein